MRLTVPELSLVLLVGASGSGKSSFASRFFKPTEIVSSDRMRGWVADDETDQSASEDAFAVLHELVDRRLARGRLTVIDATNVAEHARKPLLALARKRHVLPVAIVLDVPPAVCLARNEGRPDRDFGPHVVRRQCRELRESLRGLEREGFRKVWVLGPEDVEGVEVVRERLYNDLRHEAGPFDIVGDVHGCDDELGLLLERLGYAPDGAHPEGRRLVFLGDLVDRGPKITEVLDRVMGLVAAGRALCVPGNHEAKLLRKLGGRGVKPTHGLAETLAQFEARPPAWVQSVRAFLDGLVGHYVLAGGQLVVAHAGMTEPMQGRAARAVREFALYGETTGEVDEYGLPVRHPWADEYRGKALVVYGHTPVPEARFHNNTVCVDTGCVFGGALTALRWPERELVSVPAARVYYAPSRPLRPPEPPGPELLDVGDLLGRRHVETRLVRVVTIPEENTAAALEAMTRFAVDPRWLVYLPPTMSPSETSRLDGTLEHPAEALAYFREQGVGRVICEEKHMGSRAVLVLARDEAAARRRFGAVEGAGVIVTRTGRPFFVDPAAEAAVLADVRAAVDWKGLQSDWVVLDAELLPWTAKAKELLRDQYASVGAAARAGLGAARAAVDAAEAAGVPLGEIAARVRARGELALRYEAAWQGYAPPADSLADLRVAVFHVLASEGRVHVDRDHGWHMAQAEAMAARSPRLRATRWLAADPAAPEEAIRWWEELTAQGAEGMVVKPWDFLVTGPKGHVQPALKCRGREYLRIIYGLDYTLPENLERLRQRGLGRKRSLALRELALGVEALERFVRGESLRRVHECVSGVLALESEPVDPRL